MSALTALTLKAALDGLRKKAFSSRELTAAHIEAIEAAMAAYGGTAATWTRARGWAVAFGAMLADITDDPRMVAMGERTLRRVVAD